ncbi:MAG: 3-hydroxybutyryl-CoA dehydrogenase [Chloroflexi bacterium]|nr:3-hydroxybutyryl-CoA dehydrogenase [Chloroflexota bacterium]
MDERCIGIVGAGIMGSGVAQVAAQAGYQVILTDMSATQLEKAVAGIAAGLASRVQRARMTEAERAAALERIQTGSALSDLADLPLIVEAVYEDFDVKAGVFRTLDQLVSPETVLASNTSTLPVTELAAVTSRPQRVVGMHFFNPVPAMRLVEVIRGLATDDHAVALVTRVAEDLGKTPVVIKDSPGFVSSRLLAPMINEAAFALMEGIASREDIDTILKLGANHPMGPLELADLIGLDICLHQMETLYQSFGDPKYRPCPLLRQLVAAGYLGRKTGRGFYEYAQ